MLTLLRHARLYDPEPAGVVDLLLGGGRILAIGVDLPAPPWRADVVELHGAPVLPGLVDCHVHFAGGGGEGGAHTRVPAVQVGDLAQNGVTTAVGLLGTDASTRSLGELLANARALEHHGLSTFCYTGAYELPPPTLTGSVRGDLVHVDRFVAVGELAISDHRSSQPSFEELIRVAADAHVAGMMTGKAGLLHLHLGDGARGLELLRRAAAETELPRRVFHPTHCNRNGRLWEEAKDYALGGGFVDVTAFPPEGEDLSAGAALVEWFGEGLPLGQLSMSSDGGGCLPSFDEDGCLLRMDVGSAAGLLDAVREAVDAGVPLEWALQTCTANPARLFRLRKGRVVEGADADLVLADERLQLRSVLAGGRWLVRDGVPVVRGLFEAERRPTR